MFRARVAFALAFLLPVIAAVALYLLAPRTYEAQAKVLIRIGRETEASSPVGQQPAAIPLTTQQEVLNSEMEILSSRDIATAALKEFGTRTLFPRLDEDLSAGAPPSDAAVNAFEKALNVSAVPNSSVFIVSYEASSPALASKVLDRVLQLYEKQHIEAYARPISNFLNSQLADLEQKIEGLDAQAAKFKTESNIFDPSKERHDLLDRRSVLLTTIAQAQSDTAELAKRVAELNDLRSQTPEQIKLYSESQPSGAIEKARSELLALRVREQELGTVYTGSVYNDMLADLQKQVVDINRFLAAQGSNSSGVVRTGRNPLYDELNTEIMRAKAQLAPEQARIIAVQQEIDGIDKQLIAVEEAARTLDALQRQRDNLQTALSAFRQQQAQASILEEMDKSKIVNTKIIEDPGQVALDRPAHPKPLIYAALGLAGGIVCATLGLILLFLTHNTFLTPEAVAASAGIPVLASLMARESSARR